MKLSRRGKLAKRTRRIRRTKRTKRTKRTRHARHTKHTGKNRNIRGYHSRKGSRSKKGGDDLDVDKDVVEFINKYPDITNYNNAKIQVSQQTENGIKLAADVVTNEEIKQALQENRNNYHRAYMDILVRHQLGFQMLNDPERYKER